VSLEGWATPDRRLAHTPACESATTGSCVSLTASVRLSKGSALDIAMGRLTAYELFHESYISCKRWNGTSWSLSGCTVLGVSYRNETGNEFANVDCFCREHGLVVAARAPKYVPFLRGADSLIFPVIRHAHSEPLLFLGLFGYLFVSFVIPLLFEIFLRYYFRYYFPGFSEEGAKAQPVFVWAAAGEEVPESESPRTLVTNEDGRDCLISSRLVGVNVTETVINIEEGVQGTVKLRNRNLQSTGMDQRIFDSRVPSLLVTPVPTPREQSAAWRSASAPDAASLREVRVSNEVRRSSLVSVPDEGVIAFTDEREQKLVARRRKAEEIVARKYGDRYKFDPRVDHEHAKLEKMIKKEQRVVEEMDKLESREEEGHTVTRFICCGLIGVQRKGLPDQDGFFWKVFPYQRAHLEVDACANHWLCWLPIQGNRAGDVPEGGTILFERLAGGSAPRIVVGRAPDAPPSEGVVLPRAPPALARSSTTCP